MSEIQCPNCETVLEVKTNKAQIICKKCLESTGKRFIMVESSNNDNITNLGDGFFTKE